MKYVRSDLDEVSEAGSSGPGATAFCGTSTGNFGVRPTRLQRARNFLQQRNYFEKFLLVTLCVLTLVITLLVVTLYSVSCGHHQGRVKFERLVYNYTKIRNANNVCQDPVCVHLAARLQENMDEGVNPCDDFYSFACGSFRKHQSIPPGSHRVTTFSLQSNNNEILLRTLLEAPLSSNSSKLRNNTVHLYQSCMNVSARESTGVAPLQQLLSDLGPWIAYGPNVSLAAYNALEHINQVNIFLFRFTESVPFYSLDVQTDSFDSKRNILYIGQPSPLINREDYTKNNTVNINALETAIKEIKELLDLSLSDTDVENVIKMDRALAEMQLPMSERRDSTKTKNVTLIYVRQKYSCGILNWTEILQQFIQNVSYTINDHTPLNVRDSEFLEKLCPFIGNATKSKKTIRTLNNYLLIRAIWPFLGDLNQAAQKIQRKLWQVMQGVHGSLNPWTRCVRSVSVMYGFPLGKLFVAEHFQEESKGSVDAMIDNVKAAFNKSLRDATWMDNETRKLAMEKLSAIQNLVGYPDYFKNSSAMKDKWEDGFNLRPDAYFNNMLQIETASFHRTLQKLTQSVRVDFAMTPQSINAYYSPSFNIIAFPAGILQEPFYERQFPQYVSYGAIGAVIGHEITHGFDDDGRNFDKDGNQRQWWSNETVQQFRAAADCISSQYERFVVDHDVRVKGQLVLGESIADNGGLKAAYRAYKALNRSDDLLLPNLGSRYSKEQLFFIAYSQTWCELETSQALRQSVTVDPHPPGRMRVWGPVSNNEYFSRAFNCPLGSKMNPEKKCTVW